MLRRLILFAGVLSLQFGVFEAALRVWGSSEAAPSFQGLFIGDPVIGYRLKPNARVGFATSEFDTEIVTNNLGLRDDRDVGPKPPDERRVLILGDSLVLSVQVPLDQTFGKLLERRLNNGSSRLHYRVINAGVQGYGPVEELLFFQRIFAAVQPDLVIETLFVGNDAEDAVASRARLEGGKPLASAVHEAFTTRLRRVVRRSMVLQVLRLRVVSATARLRPKLAPPEPPLQSYAANPAPRIQDGLAITRRCVQSIASQGSTVGARTAVLLMPARFQVDDVDYDQLKDIVQQTGGELLRDAATERFDAALADLPVPRFDMLAPLRAALPGPRLFFEHTVHLTARGHQVVADALYDDLTRQGLVANNSKLPAGAPPVHR
jgi:lysophospholipase L1-like esterase